jgi:hypothetical protein
MWEVIRELFGCWSGGFCKEKKNSSKRRKQNIINLLFDFNVIIFLMNCLFGEAFFFNCTAANCQREKCIFVLFFYLQNKFNNLLVQERDCATRKRIN